MNVNVNKAECLKEVAYVGYEKIHNVCTGTVFDVAWGPVTWVGFIVMSLIGLFAFIILARIGYVVYKSS